MGLFDKIRGADDVEEVELQPQKQSRRVRQAVDASANDAADEVTLRDTSRDAETSSTSRGNRSRTRSGRLEQSVAEQSPVSPGSTRQQDDTQDDQDDEYILPGMAPPADPAGDEDATDDEGAVTNEKLERIMEQNDQIIKLLEDIMKHAENR